MSDDESRNEHLPTEGDAIFTENGSETVEHGQTGLPPWAAAVTAQLQKVFTAQLEDHLAAQAQAHRAELQELIEECRDGASSATALTRIRCQLQPGEGDIAQLCVHQHARWTGA